MNFLEIQEIIEKCKNKVSLKCYSLDFAKGYCTGLINCNPNISAEQYNELARMIDDVFDAEELLFCDWFHYDYRTIAPKNHGDMKNPYWRLPENLEHLKYCPYCGKKIRIN